MFGNSVGIVVDDDNTVINVSIVDTDDGRTIRRFRIGAESYELTVANSESLEVKGAVSDRVLVRLDRTLPSVTIDPSVPLKVSAYVVLVVPRDAATADHHIQMLHALVSFLTGKTDLDTDAATVGMETIVSRLLSGES